VNGSCFLDSYGPIAFASRSEVSVQGNFLGRVGVLFGGLELRDEIRRCTRIMCGV
jgi:hypothetical protein